MLTIAASVGFCPRFLDRTTEKNPAHTNSHTGAFYWILITPPPRQRRHGVLIR